LATVHKPHKQKGQRTFLAKKNGIKTQKHEKLSMLAIKNERERGEVRERESAQRESK